MKKLLPFLFAALVLFNSCKKEKESPAPEGEVVVTELTDKGFIQNLEITGAEKITFDSAHHAYLVELPASYASNQLDGMLKLYPGSYYYPAKNYDNPEFFTFVYRGMAPLQFVVVSRTGETRQYQLYVKHLGPFKATLPENSPFECDPDGNARFSLETLSGVGTLPSEPDGISEIKAVLRDGKTGREFTGNGFQDNLFFNGTLPLVGSKDVSLKLLFRNESLLLAEKKPFIKIKTLIRSVGLVPFVLPMLKKEPFLIVGSGLSKKARYSIKLESDFLTSSISFPAMYKEENILEANAPADIPSGTYQLNIYQNDTLLSAFNRTFADAQTDLAIGEIWTKPTDYFTSQDYSNTQKTSVERGKALFANPLPGIIRYQSSQTPVTLPSLLLAKGTKPTEIKPAVRIDNSYGTGLFPLYFGEYKIPANMEPGLYEARLVYPNRAESLPFWSKIEIK